MKLTNRDLRLMERLARAQAKKAGGAPEGAVEEIKRIELDTAWGDQRGPDSRFAQTGFGESAFGEERGTGLTAWGAL